MINSTFSHVLRHSTSYLRCNECSKDRLVYTQSRPDVFMKDVISENKETYVCGNDLDLGDRNFTEKLRPFVRMKISCATPPELQLFSSNVLVVSIKNMTCGWCGQRNANPPADEGEASMFLPVCSACFIQQKKMRSARTAPKFDRNARREANVAASMQRRDDLQNARNSTDHRCPFFHFNVFRNL